MKNKKSILIVIILAFLTAIEALSIDLYLPAFVQISEDLKVSSSSVQVSLSLFLAGFAIGQLIWGPLSDKFGRKKPLLISLVIYTIASIGCSVANNIEFLWIARFIQALGGCGGVVLARAIVSDYYPKSETLSIYATLALIMGVGPILGPILGSQLLQLGDWHYPFYAMVILGLIGILIVLLYLPETHKKTDNYNSNVISTYKSLFKEKQFVIHVLQAGVVNGVLMIYIGNAPFLIIEKAQFSENVFSIIFATNAIGLMISSFITSKIQKSLSAKRIVFIASIMMLITAILITVTSAIINSYSIILIILFFYVFPMGMLFPTTTDLALAPFDSSKSGAASSMFGAIQLAIAFIMSVSAGFFLNGDSLSLGVIFCFFSIISLIIIFMGNKK